MSRLTLRLPDTLHEQIRALAKHENVSINQYVVYALTRQVTHDYTVQAVPEKMIRQQRAASITLLQNLGEASFEQIQAVLREREEVEPEVGLTPAIIEKMQARISGKKESS
jgi:predicted HicB family RNase H-like nuclease